MTAPIVLPLGEAAFTIRLGEVASVANAQKAAALAKAIEHAKLRGVSEIVPAVASVAVFYEPAGTNQVQRKHALESLVAHSSSLPLLPSSQVHAIPTRYDGVDLDDVATRVGLSTDDVVRLHSDREYHVLSLGFLPGWAYLGELDPALALPRRSTPRTRIPAGAVAIMGSQTGIYPRVSPGGWNIIGSTSVVLFDANRDAPALFAPGDRVRFTPVP